MTPTQFTAGLFLRHFRRDELFYFGASHHARFHNNEIPPENLWPNIVPTIWVVDMARSALGDPITILSGYRSPAYNTSIHGASRSQHMKFTALDISCSSTTRLYNLLKKFRDAGVFKGGLGKYQSFVHIDTRGHNATWRG